MTWEIWDFNPYVGDVRDFVCGLADDWGKFPILDLFHATAVCVAHRKLGGNSIPWPQALVSIILASLGGTLITNVVILGQPASWMTSDEVLPCYILMFILTRWCPFDLWHKLVTTPVVKWALSIVDNVSWATAITAWGAEKALFAEHTRARTSIVACLLSGFFSGCGGGLLHSAYCLTDKTWRFRTPRGLASNVPSFAISMAGILSVLNYVVTNPHHALPYEPILTTRDSRFLLFLILFTLDSLVLPSTMRRYIGFAPMERIIQASKAVINVDNNKKQK